MPTLAIAIATQIQTGAGRSCTTRWGKIFMRFLALIEVHQMLTCSTGIPWPVAVHKTGPKNLQWCCSSKLASETPLHYCCKQNRWRVSLPVVCRLMLYIATFMSLIATVSCHSSSILSKMKVGEQMKNLQRWQKHMISWVTVSHPRS